LKRGEQTLRKKNLEGIVDVPGTPSDGIVWKGSEKPEKLGEKGAGRCRKPDKFWGGAPHTQRGRAKKTLGAQNLSKKRGGWEIVGGGKKLPAPCSLKKVLKKREPEKIGKKISGGRVSKAEKDFCKGRSRMGGAEKIGRRGQEGNESEVWVRNS